MDVDKDSAQNLDLKARCIQQHWLLLAAFAHVISIKNSCADLYILRGQNYVRISKL